MAKVIHIKDAPRGWQDDPRYVYIGRPKKGLGDGYFGNPFPVDRIRDREEAIVSYERHARERIALDEVFARRVADLNDKILVCFCSPKPCHGNVLSRLAEELHGTPFADERDDFLDDIIG